MADPTPSTDPESASLADRAVELARRWVVEAAAADVDPAAERLAGVLQDANGLPFTLGFVDGVMRPESLGAAASQLHRIAPIVPDFLPWYLRSAVRLGGGVAQILPSPVVPIARRVLRDMVGHLVVDARPAKLGPAIERIRESGARLNLNLLGEAVLGEAEAQRRLDGIHDLIRRPDVDYVSVKVSAIISHISMWAFDEVVDAVVERLLPLYLTAASDRTFINLDMEEYRDLDLTIAVFTRVLEDPRLEGIEAGIVLQAYLPDALPALQQLTAWARDRVDRGGAPIKVRLVKGANLAMERVESQMHGWEQATYDTKLDTDANYLRCLDWALRAENIDAVHLGIAGHNLFGIAYAWLLAGERGLRGLAADGTAAGQPPIEFEMLLGMAQGQVQAVSREVGEVLLYVPVVKPDEFDVAISYLVRRLEENASNDNFLSAAFRLGDDESLFVREQDRFLDALDRSTSPTLQVGALRTQDRLAPVHESVRPAPAAVAPEEGLTKAVLGISRGSDDSGEPFLETAVYAPRELDEGTGGAPGFENTADSDPSLPVNREWAREIHARIADSTLGAATIEAARIDDDAVLESTIAGVRDAGAHWGARPAAERADVLLRAAAALEARRGELIEVAAAETGKVFAEADIEVSEAVDFARYYAAKARELDAVAGAAFEPARVTVVTPPWNFPLAIPAGGVLAALAAGSGVVFKPAPQSRRCAAVIAETLWEVGVPRDVLALVDIEEGDLGRTLIAHESVDRVILTGSWETAALFRSWRPDLPLLAETSGKNAMIITPSADLDLAVSDLVRSAFGHAGQKCSAASLAILVGPVGRSKRFARQLADATRSLHVGWPTDPRAEVGPVIERPQGKLAWALTELEGEEQWLIEPAVSVDDESGRLWRPGIRVGVQPGSRFHTEEFFGPVLGIMHAPTLERAIEMQNAVAYGLTAGLHTQDPAELSLWLDRVQAGNLYVNRGITGAIVQRQPFGGWKRSSVGPGTKAGGPNYLVGLGTWRSSGSGPVSSTLHLRGLDSRITELIESAQPSLDYEAFEWLRRSALSDALAWDREFGQVRDVSRLGIERNLFRYRPVPVAIRATADAGWQELLRVVVAAVRAGSAFVLSTPVGLPPEVRRALGALGAVVFMESDEEWIDRMRRREAGSGDALASLGAEPRPNRVRLVGSRDAVAALHRALAVAVDGDPDLAVYDGEVTSAGRIELLPFVHEQAIAITAHRYGNPDDWSASAI
ncbi:RHH-type proline utilization regulon transcriptional repressor/proline dehydrogenase/delta 1-pyrroline-5-carboxylate dehydrogenase [Microbacterium phyllosphaerae]|uniref:L-glutamate gamma-semialdehyde dehydrogenase n=1 Tax=Microbacterium phyllosphaerae TaxID=124798 RepID=A0ABS4WJY0_9MICO|nr:bifunctional proline dehydrogenase/L-glutamate gamma-semialdehyde dehydrogenase [Microbacterium phyllosphaerae]MBP2376512.1 RHH-type proline utilization regulon transcriptional repressor/proline dehydrogenase/delta 1-pyrroline-5-carboxylate dehydrogenase [Microbacterium phyllosphaerae]